MRIVFTVWLEEAFLRLAQRPLRCLFRIAHFLASTCASATLTCAVAAATCTGVTAITVAVDAATCASVECVLNAFDTMPRPMTPTPPAIINQRVHTGLRAIAEPGVKYASTIAGNPASTPKSEVNQFCRIALLMEPPHIESASFLELL